MVQKGRFHHQPGFPFHWEMRGFGSELRIRSLTSLSELMVFGMKREIPRCARNGKGGCLLGLQLPVQEVRFLGFARNDKGEVVFFVGVRLPVQEGRFLGFARNDKGGGGRLFRGGSVAGTGSAIPRLRSE